MSMTDLRLAAAQPGDTLPNGATVLDITLGREEIQDDTTFIYGYVLALREREFAVWRYGIDSEGRSDTFWGHYFPYLFDAYNHYNMKVQESHE